MGRKHCGKRRNGSLQAISPFPKVYLKDLYGRHVKKQALFGKGLTLSLVKYQALSLPGDDQIKSSGLLLNYTQELTQVHE